MQLRPSFPLRLSPHATSVPRCRKSYLTPVYLGTTMGVMATSRGQELLLSVLHGGVSQGAVARKVGVARSVVTRWAQGRQAPMTRSRAVLESDFDIPILSWDQPAEAQESQPPAA